MNNLAQLKLEVILDDKSVKVPVKIRTSIKPLRDVVARCVRRRSTSESSTSGISTKLQQRSSDVTAVGDVQNPAACVRVASASSC